MADIIPREEVFDTYWKFAAKRQEIFFKRLQGASPPWTDDPVLQIYKFCNTYRASDRVSQFLIRNVIYSKQYSKEDIIFRILLFKLFNKIETWKYLENRFGEITIKTFNIPNFSLTLANREQEGHSLYSNAYIMAAHNAFGFERKYLNHLHLIEFMIKDNFPKKLIGAKSLEGVFLLLKSYPLIGNFLAYQYSIDLNYSEVIDFSENGFTKAGPGALRGIKKCFLSTGNKTPEEIIMWMVENQDKEFERLGIKFKNLFGRKLHAIDCQGLFCETDKYSRVAFSNLKSARKKIKAKFTENNNKIGYFYPPKWNLK